MDFHLGFDVLEAGVLLDDHEFLFILFFLEGFHTNVAVLDALAVFDLCCDSKKLFV